MKRGLNWVLDIHRFNVIRKEKHKKADGVAILIRKVFAMLVRVCIMGTEAEFILFELRSKRNLIVLLGIFYLSFHSKGQIEVQINNQMAEMLKIF